MENEALLIGSAVLAVTALGAFIGVILKFTQPINDLRVVIQKLNDNLDSLAKDNDKQNKRLDKHGEEIDDLKTRVDKVETKVDLFHGKG